MTNQNVVIVVSGSQKDTVQDVVTMDTNILQNSPFVIYKTRQSFRFGMTC